MTSEGQTFYRTFTLHFYAGGNIYLEKKKGKKRSDFFPKEQDARHGSSECPPALN